MSLRPTVFDLDGGHCVGCDKRLYRSGTVWNWSVHHVIRQTTMKARGLRPKWWRGPALCILLCAKCHGDQTSKMRTVPLERLPVRVHRSVAILGPWCRDVLVREHPPRAFTIEDRGYATPCWVWVGNLTPKGYATTSRYVENGRNKTWRAHRLFWEAQNGPIPDDMEVDHLCRVRSCVNPEHMEVVTHTENMRRAATTKLSIEQAREIQRRHSAALAGRGKVPNGTIIALAEEFGVSRAAIHDAVSRSWR